MICVIEPNQILKVGRSFEKIPHGITMNNSTAMNDVVRVLGTELGKENAGRVVIGETEEEKAVLLKHSNTGKRRAVMGFAAGATVGAGLWRGLGGQRRLLGGFTMASTGLAGFMYGILSIRHDLFVDILTLPSEVSPFAVRARAILDEQLPTNEFYMEVKELFKKQQAENGSWDSTPSFPALKTPRDDADTGFRGFENSGGSSRLPRLPKPEESFTFEPVSEEKIAEKEAENSKTSIKFFFGSDAPADNAASTSSPSYDFYGSQPSQQKPPARPVRDDDDGYFNDGWEDEDDKNKPKSTTWEELRRRAASGKQ